MSQTFVQINKSALRHNLTAIHNHVKTPIIAVVKANAYGCGAIESGRVFAEAGAKMLAVTRVEEALPLRENGIIAPILLLAPTPSDEYEAALQNDLTLSISTFEEAQHISALAVKLEKIAHLHVKIDTGMHRFGAHPSKTVEVVQRSRSLPQIEVGGVFSHLHSATNPDEALSEKQKETFDDAIFGLDGLTFHLANSGAAIRFPAMRYGAVRPGTLLYGQYPDPSIQKIHDLKLQDPFKVQSRIVAIQNVKKGEKIGYGLEWQALKDSRLAILAIGYADGLSMEPNARPQTPLSAIKAGLERAARLQRNANAGRTVEIRGQRFALAGRIAMQTCAVDITNNEEIQLGELATVPMRRLAAGAHLKRVYVDS
jgi:alanine racemase